MGFKVIVVGGGLAGLGLAHSFTKAGIDFVVLERSEDLTPPGGASLAMWPHNVRVLDQLGLLKRMQEIDCNTKYKYNMKKDGTLMAKSNMLEHAGESLGHPWMCFRRPKLHQALYESLPEREIRILGGKQVASIETTAEGVKVTCKDDSVYEGSMVVGADGANSTVRKELAKATGDEKLAEPFTTTYRGLYGVSNWTRGIAENTLHEMHSERLTIQLIPSHDGLMFTAYQRLPATSKTSVRCSEEEKEAFAAEVGDMYVAPEVQFKDVWSERTWSYASGLEEGIADKWYGERVCLIGDTVNKMTPNVGLGLNSGWQSAVALTNGLRRLLAKDPEPSTEALNQLFRDYQGLRKKNASDMAAVSGLYTRVVAWNNPVWKFADQYVTKHIGGDCKLLDLLLVPLVKQGLTLDFLNEDGFKAGKVAWSHPRTVVASDEGAAMSSSPSPSPLKAAAVQATVTDVDQVAA